MVKVMCFKLIKSQQWTIVLWCFTFLLVLPLLSQKFVFSPFFYSSESYKDGAHESVDSLNTNRFHDAQNYLTSLNSAENNNFHSRLMSKAKMIAMVITKKRGKDCNPQHYLNLNCEPHYLQQTLVALDKESKLYSKINTARGSSSDFVPIIICNVDPNWNEFRDFEMVKDAFPVTYRYKKRKSLILKSSEEKRSQETSDYAFCLNSILNITSQNSVPPKYVLVMEDDAVPFPKFFKNIFQILNSRVEQMYVQGEWMPGVDWSFVKLYFPELWAGFGTDLMTLFELFNIGVVGALVGIFCKLALSNRRDTNNNNYRNLAFCGLISALYAIALVQVISRQTLLEIRRIDSFFLKVSQSPGCCTPAVIYPTKLLPRIVEYLTSKTCSQCASGVDLALDDFSDMNNLKPYLVQPNLVKHVGMHSTLTARKNAVHILFHDLLYG